MVHNLWCAIWRNRLCCSLGYALGIHQVWGGIRVSVHWLCCTDTLMSTRDWTACLRNHSFFARWVMVSTNSLPRRPLSETILVEFKRRVGVWTRWPSLTLPTLRSCEYINKSLERYDFQTPLNIISMIVPLGIKNPRSYFRSLFFPQNQNFNCEEWGVQKIWTLCVPKTLQPLSHPATALLQLLLTNNFSSLWQIPGSGNVIFIYQFVKQPCEMKVWIWLMH